MVAHRVVVVLGFLAGALADDRSCAAGDGACSGDVATEVAAAAAQMDVTFTNYEDYELEVFWVGSDGERFSMGTIEG